MRRSSVYTDVARGPESCTAASNINQIEASSYDLICVQIGSSWKLSTASTNEAAEGDRQVLQNSAHLHRGLRAAHA